MIKHNGKKCSIQGCSGLLFAKKYCKYHYVSLTQKPLNRSIISIKSKPIKKNYKSTGEAIIFKEIWNERNHNCERCGKYLFEYSHTLFHHIIPKSKDNSLRLVKSNITLVCFECHQWYHFGFTK